MAGGRVPRSVARFASYLNDTDDHLQSNRPAGPGGTPVFELLGLSVPQADEWSSRRVDFRDDLYPKWTNKDAKTETVNEDVVKFMNEFFVFSKPLLNKMAASENATTQDENVFNFKINRKKPVRPTSPISEVVVLDLTAIGGGDLRVKGRQDEEAKRGKIPETAKAIEVRYKIGPVGEAPANVSETDEVVISTRASFRLNVGAENHNLNIYAYARWIDTTNPARAGSWTEMAVSGIL